MVNYVKCGVKNPVKYEGHRINGQISCARNSLSYSKIWFKNAKQAHFMLHTLRHTQFKAISKKTTFILAFHTTSSARVFEMLTPSPPLILVHGIDAHAHNTPIHTPIHLQHSRAHRIHTAISNSNLFLPSRHSYTYPRTFIHIIITRRMAVKYVMCVCLCVCQ